MISKFTDIGKIYNGWDAKELECFLDYVSLSLAKKLKTELI